LIVPGILETISWTFLLSPRTGIVNVFITDFIIQM